MEPLPRPTTNGYQYAFGDGGKAFVAIGTDISGLFSLVVGTQAPAAHRIGGLPQPYRHI